ncbi:MAG: hypothetical protein ACXWV2_11725 [Chitinophagaceae bacterium]
MEVDYNKYEKMDFTCKCGWQGKGAELVNGEFSEVHLIGDLSCPKCSEQIAFWQWPMKEDKKPRRK